MDDNFELANRKANRVLGVLADEPASIDDDLKDTPNWDKLTPQERRMEKAGAPVMLEPLKLQVIAKDSWDGNNEDAYIKITEANDQLDPYYGTFWVDMPDNEDLEAVIWRKKEQQLLANKRMHKANLYSARAHVAGLHPNSPLATAAHQKLAVAKSNYNEAKRALKRFYKPKAEHVEE